MTPELNWLETCDLCGDEYPMSTPTQPPECNHPKEPNNLKDGECGTCYMVGLLRRIASCSTSPAIVAHCESLAEIFRSGQAVYDITGKTLLEHTTPTP